MGCIAGDELWIVSTDESVLSYDHVEALSITSSDDMRLDHFESYVLYNECQRRVPSTWR